MASPLRPELSGGSAGRAPELALVAAELGRLVAGWNDTARDVPEVTLAELFQAQVARTPGAAAVVDGELTLRQLRPGAVGPGRVESTEVAEEHLDRPAVADRVVHRQEQRAVPVVEAAEQRAQQRHLAHADRAGLDLEDELLDDHVPGLVSDGRDVPDLQWHLAWRADQLVSRTGVPDHEGAQQFVAKNMAKDRSNTGS